MAGSFPERFLGLSLEMPKNMWLESFWSDVWTWGWKCLKTGGWKPSGAFFGPGPEMLENVWLEALWSDFGAWAWKCLKIGS